MQDDRTLSYKLSDKLSIDELSKVDGGTTCSSWSGSASGGSHLVNNWDGGVDYNADY